MVSAGNLREISKKNAVYGLTSHFQVASSVNSYTLH